MATKYKGKKTCKALIQHLEQGYSFDSFTGVAEVARATLYNWVDKYPKFSESKSIGEGKAQLLMERIAMSKIRGQEILDSKGKVVINPKLTDTTMNIFFLKTRFHKTYGENKRVEMTGKDGGPIETATKTDLSKLTDAELQSLAEIADKMEENGEGVKV
jgi:hypothetical protein